MDDSNIRKLLDASRLFRQLVSPTESKDENVEDKSNAVG